MLHVSDGGVPTRELLAPLNRSEGGGHISHPGLRASPAGTAQSKAQRCRGRYGLQVTAHLLPASLARCPVRESLLSPLHTAAAPRGRWSPPATVAMSECVCCPRDMLRAVFDSISDSVLRVGDAALSWSPSFSGCSFPLAVLPMLKFFHAPPLLPPPQGPLSMPRPSFKAAALAPFCASPLGLPLPKRHLHLTSWHVDTNIGASTPLLLSIISVSAGGAATRPLHKPKPGCQTWLAPPSPPPIQAIRKSWQRCVHTSPNLSPPSPLPCVGTVSHLDRCGSLLPPAYVLLPPSPPSPHCDLLQPHRLHPSPTGCLSRDQVKCLLPWGLCTHLILPCQLLHSSRLSLSAISSEPPRPQAESGSLGLTVTAVMATNTYCFLVTSRVPHAF